MDRPCGNPEPHDQHLWTPPDNPPGLDFAVICPGVKE